jgi:hypothetical protein
LHPGQFLLACIYLMSIWAAPAFAGTAQASFAVQIDLQNSNTITPNTGLCRSTSMIGTFGASMTVYCATGAIASFSGDPSTLPWTTKQDSSYRFVTQVSRAGELLGTIDIYTGGTVTSWRVIRLTDRDYLEMMVHW